MHWNNGSTVCIKPTLQPYMYVWAQHQHHNRSRVMLMRKGLFVGIKLDCCVGWNPNKQISASRCGRCRVSTHTIQTIAATTSLVPTHLLSGPRGLFGAGELQQQHAWNHEHTRCCHPWVQPTTEVDRRAWYFKTQLQTIHPKQTLLVCRYRIWS